MNDQPGQIAIVGAGPIGLEAALLSVTAGFDVNVFERGQVAENVRQWGHVRLFSPFGLNSSLEGRAAVTELTGHDSLPARDAFLTGREFADQYLLPLSQIAPLAGRIHEATKIVAIGRTRTWKRDLIGRPERSADPFRLLAVHGGRETEYQADYIFDCSGTYPHHNWLGAGGVPCVGERIAEPDISYHLPDIAGSDRQQFSGRRTLVVGSGYSAATAVVTLAELAETNPQTEVVWVTRTGRTPPIDRIENDTLAERDRLAETVNRLALESAGPVDWRPGRLVRSIEQDGASDGFIVTLQPTVPNADAETGTDEMIERVVVDRVIANVGYRPDRGLYEELQVHECYASGGPIKLAAALLGEMSADCLKQSAHEAETLCNPEPQFFILGAKSYGRDSRFLINIGLQQIRDVLTLVGSPVGAKC